MSTLTGGCQCGAIRFSVEEPLGRASLCHCRMCQKATGGFFGPLVGSNKLIWTRGEPKRFASSNKVERGFCPDCGTMLTFEWEKTHIELMIGAFDDPTGIEPVIQMGVESRLPWIDKIAGLPVRPTEDAPWQKAVVSNQHPDHDTDVWPPAGKKG